MAPIRGGTALVCVLAAALAGPIRAEEVGDPLPGVLRSAPKVKAALAFVAAFETKDEGEQRRFARDPEADCNMMATYLVAGHLTLGSERPWGPAAKALADLAKDRKDAGDLSGVVERLLALGGGDRDRERRLVALAADTSRRLDAKDGEGAIRAVVAAEGDVAGEASPFAWLALGRSAYAYWARGGKDGLSAAEKEYRRGVGIAAALKWPRAEIDSLTSLAKMQVAAEAFQRAAETLTTLAARHGEIEDRVGEAYTLANLVVASRRLGRTREALASADRTVALWENLAKPAELANARVARALVLIDLGRRVEAIAVVREALSHLAAGGSSARALVVLGMALLQTGRHAEAREPLERAIALYGELRDARGTGSAQQHLASLLRRTGDVPGAEEMNRKAIESARAGGDRGAEGRALANMANLLVATGRAEEALPLLERALKISSETGDEPGAQESRMILARAELGRGRSARALEVAGQVLQGLSRGHPLRVYALLLTGDARADAGDKAGSQKAYEEAFQDVWATGDLSPVAARACFIYALIALERGHAEEALAVAQHALAIRRMGVQGFGEEEAEDLRAQARLAAELAFAAASLAGGLEGTFLFAESARAALLAEGLVDRDALLTARLPADLAQAERASREGVEAARAALVEALRAGAAEEETRRARAAVDAAYAGREKVVAQVRRQARPVADLVWAAPVALADVEAELPEDTALLLWQFTRTKLHAMVVRRGATTRHDLGQNDVPRLVDAWLRAASTPDGAEERLAERLYDALLQPIEAQLAGVKRLVVVPDEALAFLPFDALLRRDDSSSQRVIERWEVTLVPSATALMLLKRGERGAPRGRGLLAVGDPRYPPAPADARPASGFAFPRPLPESRREVEAIAARFPDGERTVLLGERADRAGVEGALAAHAGRWRALHFACHAVVDPEHPRLSGLVLAGGEVLDLDRVHGLRADANLVVLSACETGRGRLLAGEGVLGLVRGFFFAGAPRVVASSWRVADEDARLLMDGFYRRYVAEGLTPAAALRAAKRERMAARPHPYHWAAFSLWGLPD